MSRIKRDGIPKALKWAVLDRDNYTCRYCSARGVPMEIDHVFPESRGGPTVLENLVTACEPCNRAKRDRLGIYPLPLDYLERLNQAQAIIDWFRDYQRETAEKELTRYAAEVEVEMKKRLAQINARFRRRRRVFALIRSIPTFGIFMLVVAGFWLVYQAYLINTAGALPYPPALAIGPYLLFVVSLAGVPLYTRALTWYSQWPYPHYESVSANKE